MTEHDRHPILELTEVSDELYHASDLEIRNFSEQRIWLFDLEATGLNTTVERVTQVAGIPLEGGRLIDEEAFVEFVNPDGVPIPQVVQDLTGISNETVADAEPFSKIWGEHLNAAEGSTLWMGQSVFEFDVPLLETEFERHGMPVQLPPILDSVVLATWLLGAPEKRWSTSALLQRYQVDTEGLRRHDALDDVKILGRILLPMIETIREEHDDVVRIPADRPIGIKRHAPVTD